MTRERMACAVEFRVEADEQGQPTLRGHAAVFDSPSVDLGAFREVLQPGCFGEVLATADPVALFNHDPNIVLGRRSAGTLELYEDQRGLAVTIRPPETTAARDVVALVARGDVRHMSFAFKVAKGGETWGYVDGQRTRTISKVGGLYDVSVVVNPAYPATGVGLRSAEEVAELTRRALEELPEPEPVDVAPAPGLYPDVVAARAAWRRVAFSTRKP